MGTRKVMSAEELKKIPIEALREFVKENTLIIDKDGVEVIKEKERIEAFVEALKNLENKIQKKKRIKSSKGKHPSNLTPPKKKRK